MARDSLSNLRAQIAKLEQRADAIKRTVVSRLQKEIKAHGLTAEDLFGGGFIVGSGRKAEPTGAKRASKASSKSATKAAKYGDSQGNTWGGMGKRPQWLRDRLEAGATLEEFLLGNAGKMSDAEAAAPASAPTKKAAAKRPAKKVARAKAEKPAAKAARKTAAKPKAAAKKAAKVARKTRAGAEKSGEQAAQA